MKEIKLIHSANKEVKIQYLNGKCGVIAKGFTFPSYERQRLLFAHLFA